MDKEIERIYDRVDELLEKECYLIDIFPRQISEEKSRQYLALEGFYSSDEQIKKISGQFMNVILKLYAYYEFDHVIDDFDELHDGFEDMVSEIEHVYEMGRGGLSILINGENSLLAVYGDSLYMCLYAPSEDMKRLTEEICLREGLYFRKAPEFDDYEENDDEE